MRHRPGHRALNSMTTSGLRDRFGMDSQPNGMKSNQHVLESLSAVRASQQQVVLLSGTLTSPSTKEIIAEWSKRDPNFRHVVY